MDTTRFIIKNIALNIACENIKQQNNYGKSYTETNGMLFVYKISKIKYEYEHIVLNRAVYVKK